jgi:hypothetical protein
MVGDGCSDEASKEIAGGHGRKRAEVTWRRVGGCERVVLVEPGPCAAPRPVHRCFQATRAMADRRRSTMQPAPDPHGNARSQIPMPSTIKKPAPTNMRMSLSGPALRGPYQAPPGTNPRQSTMRSQNVNPLLQSTSKHGRTPLNR